MAEVKKPENPAKTFLVAVIIIGAGLLATKYIGGEWVVFFDIAILVGVLFLIIGIVQVFKNRKKK